MPVLLIATVTCPSLSSSPFCTLSSVGAASLIHKSWLGFVKTPMLTLDAATVTVELMMTDLVYLVEGRSRVVSDLGLRAVAQGNTSRERAG